MALSIEKIYTDTLTTQTGDVPCAGENGELGKYALLSDIHCHCAKLENKIETINTTGSYTPVMTTAAISAKFTNDLNTYKKDFIQIVTSIVDAEIEDIKTKYNNINSITNENIQKCNEQISDLYIKYNKENDFTTGNFQFQQKLNDILNQYISKVENDLNTTKNDVSIIKTDIINTNTLLNKQNLELKQIITSLQTQIALLDNQNKQLFKNMISVNNKLNGLK